MTYRSNLLMRLVGAGLIVGSGWFGACQPTDPTAGLPDTALSGGQLAQRYCGTYEKRVLWESPGGVKTVVRDLDQDGRPDLLVLMAQGREGLYAFYNQGEGRFGMKALLQFPPVYGSSDFTLADLDQDGDEDVLLVQGDNADLSPVLKPYHGVRVYRNEGGYELRKRTSTPCTGSPVC